MSAFNSLLAEISCPVCKRPGLFTIQFKYGDTWQYEYHLGEMLEWGGNDYGEPRAGIVCVRGLGGPCSNCLTDDLPFVITIKDNQLMSVEPAVDNDGGD